MTQKERTMYERRRMSAGASGGGGLSSFAPAVFVAATGASAEAGEAAGCCPAVSAAIVQRPGAAGRRRVWVLVGWPR